MKIWCPGCEWKPDATSRWSCAPEGCYHSWNTFDTGGVCPACAKIWKHTQCLSCHNHFPHEEWYHDEAEVSLEAQIDLTVEEAVEVPLTTSER